MAATVKRATLENIFGVIGGGRDWKVCLLGDDEVGYSTEEMWTQEPWFYRCLDDFIFPVSNFIFLNLRQ